MSLCSKVSRAFFRMHLLLQLSLLTLNTTQEEGAVLVSKPSALYFDFLCSRPHFSLFVVGVFLTSSCLLSDLIYPVCRVTWGVAPEQREVSPFSSLPLPFVAVAPSTEEVYTQTLIPLLNLKLVCFFSSTGWVAGLTGPS